MRFLGIGLLVLAAVFGLSAHPALGRETDEEPEPDGGTVDFSLRHTAPVVISSEDIESFRLRFHYTFSGEEALRTKYPEGWYDLRLEKGEDGADCTVIYWQDAGPQREWSFPVSVEALSRLDALLKEHDVAQIHGHSLWNSATGDDMRLEVLYGDGETIRASGVGGSVKPDERYYREEWFIDFFRALGRAYGHDVPGPRLTRCVYRYSGDMEGRFLEMEMAEAEDGTAQVAIERRAANGAPEDRRSFSVPAGKLEEAALLVDRGDLVLWSKAPLSEMQELDAGTRSAGFLFEDGTELWLHDTHDLPKEGFAAVNALAAFLGALEEGAP